MYCFSFEQKSKRKLAWLAKGPSRDQLNGFPRWRSAEKTAGRLSVCMLSWAVFVTLFAAYPSSGLGQQPSNERIVEFLEKYCGRCHQDTAEGGINYINDLTKLVERKKIVPGDLDKSPIWQRLVSDSEPMPPEGEEPRPTAKEKRQFETWLRSLRPEASSGKSPADRNAAKPAAQRKPVTTPLVVRAIHSWLARIPAEDRRYQRFFVLNHLHNLPTRSANKNIGLDNQDLDMARAAVSKTLNSLSWSSQIILPRMVDAEQTVLAIDIRDVEWDANLRKGRPDLWNLLVEKYPYGLRHDAFAEAGGEQAKARQIYEMTMTDIPWIRADWFVAASLQPENYHTLLYDAVLPELRKKEAKLGKHLNNRQLPEQPMNVQELYNLLQVDPIGNLRRQRAVRAGFSRSGVSSQPRLIERHPAVFGFIWGSLDFAPGNTSMNVLAHPLGPDGVFDPDRFAKQSFQHDGGEYIFSLPNGLHGYLLANAQGDRLNFGPQEIVEDRGRILGNAIIANGLSCIACHKQGLITDFQDEVRFGIDGLPADAKKLVRKVYLDRPDLDVLIERDLAKYRAAVGEALLPFLDEAKRSSIQEGAPLVEPVAPLAKRFLRDTIGLELMAVELGVSTQALTEAIEGNESLRSSGMVALLKGAKINREIWETGEDVSLYQMTARALGLGTPVTLAAAKWRGAALKRP
jgi:hypothetical protein